MSKTALKCKTYYDNGWYTAEMLQNFVEKGKITEDEYAEITGAEGAEG